jgi:hypothetical protein
MFYGRKIRQLEYEINMLRGEVRELRLENLSDKGSYSFNVGDKIEILRGKFKIQNRKYDDRGEFKGRVPYMKYFEKFVPIYCLVGIDSEEVIYIEEYTLLKRLSEFKCINENINRN